MQKIIPQEQGKKTDHKMPILLSISGPDQPGITATLMQLAVEHQLSIIDIGQAVIHGHLHFGLVFNQTTGEQNFLKEVLFSAKKLNLDIQFSPLEIDPIQKTTFNELVISSVSHKPFENIFLAELTQLLANHQSNIKNINYYYEKISSTWIIEFLTQQITPIDLKDQLYQLANKHQVDLAINQQDIFRNNKRLVVFDMDSTLIEQEVIDLLAVKANKGDQVKYITERAMNGEIDFKKALYERVSLLKGLSSSAIDEVKKELTFTQGTKECIKVLKKLGIKTAIISGGFKEFASHVAQELGIDSYFANQLVWQDGKLTGELTGPIIDAHYKAQLLEVLTQTHQIHIQQAVAVGDGSNDLLMLQKAGLGIAFQGKDILRKKTRAQVNFGSMLNILPMMGIPLKFL